MIHVMSRESIFLCVLFLCCTSISFSSCPRGNCEAIIMTGVILHLASDVLFSPLWSTRSTFVWNKNKQKSGNLPNLIRTLHYAEIIYLFIFKIILSGLIIVPGDLVRNVCEFSTSLLKASVCLFHEKHI